MESRNSKGQFVKGRISPFKGKPAPWLKGNKNGFKKGYKSAFWGHKHTDETKEKMKNKAKGRIAWNKDKGININIQRAIKLYETGLSLKEVAGKLGIGSDTTIKKRMDIIGYKRRGEKGTIHEKTKQKIREYVVNNPNKIFINTSIELKVEAELQKRNINYQKQVPLCKIAIVDFYLPEYRIIIQCDGDYWHNLPDHKIRDEQQDKVLTFNGFNVYRFWEHEINRSVEECINKLF